MADELKKDDVACASPPPCVYHALHQCTVASCSLSHSLIDTSRLLGLIGDINEDVDASLSFPQQTCLTLAYNQGSSWLEDANQWSLKLFHAPLSHTRHERKPIKHRGQNVVEVLKSAETEVLGHVPPITQEVWTRYLHKQDCSGGNMCHCFRVFLNTNRIKTICDHVLLASTSNQSVSAADVNVSISYVVDFSVAQKFQWLVVARSSKTNSRSGATYTECAATDVRLDSAIVKLERRLVGARQCAEFGDASISTIGGGINATMSTISWSWSWMFASMWKGAMFSLMIACVLAVGSGIVALFVLALVNLPWWLQVPLCMVVSLLIGQLPGLEE